MTLEEWPRRVAALAQCRVVDLETASLDPSDEHHLRRVLRAREGDDVVLTDGAGSWRFARVATDALELDGPVRFDPAPSDTTLYVSPVRGARNDWAVAKATEVGLARIVPLNAARVQVRLTGAHATTVVERWRRVAEEAANQSRRTHALVVTPPLAPHEVPDDVAICVIGASGDWRGVANVAVGPEGGWAPGEWRDARREVGLGPSVLRAETAGVVAAAVVAFSHGDWGFTLGPRT